jgi:hypothetical protein
MKKTNVSIHAVAARIRRALAKEGSSLKKSRSFAVKLDLGDWYIVNDRNSVVCYHIDIEKLANEMGLLKPYEQLAQ